MQATERLYLTENRKQLVREGDSRGAFLYAAPGDEIPDSAVEMFGLVDGTLPQGKSKAKEAAPAEDKEAAPAEDKEAAPAEDREAAPAEDKAGASVPAKTRRRR